ncbi:ATP-binding protein [Hahella ganghwensis]|uniref:ATP-binding protein n=1 Tax=Hahella ganghwensis TaxID=286420 RepID=UPI0003801E61|nr:ATP-binding protein [Hahella ganghwensis]
MKISHIKVENFLGIQRVDVELVSPITVFAGPNGAGKSCFQNAIRSALTGFMPRIDKKKEAKQLVKDGAKKGSAEVTINGEKSTIEVPSLKGVHGSVFDNPAISYVINPASFAGASADERRTSLFEITGVNPDTNNIKERMEQRGCDMKLAAYVIPLLRSGFPEAHKEAKDKASEARGAWKSVTGETYGSQKAEGWERECPAAVDEDRLEQMENRMAVVLHEVGEKGRKIGGLQGLKLQAQDEQAIVSKLQEIADQYETIHTQYLAAHKRSSKCASDLNTLKRKVMTGDDLTILECPHCQGKVAHVSDSLVAYQDPADVDPAVLAEYEELKQEAERAYELANELSLELDRSKRAQDELSNRPRIEVVTDEQIAALDAEASALMEEHDLLHEDLKAARAEKLEYELAVNANRRAAESHELVKAWSEIADALAPDGIPSEILGEAIKPINDRLKVSAAGTEWMTPRIHADMSITADGRLYHLLSESEQWRVDVLIAEAFSHVSGLKFLVIDRFDVLHPSLRSSLINWLADIAGSGQIDSAIVLGTLKKPTATIEGVMSSFWIEGGVLTTQKQEQQAA